MPDRLHAILKPRTRLVNFRVTDDEFGRL